MLSLFGLGVFAANNISVNQGVPVSLGAGYSASTACDNAITINTENQFVNSQFMISTISLSDIDATYPNGCGSSILDLSLIVNGTLVNASFPIASSALNSTYQFGGTSGYGYFANTALTPFGITSLSSVALSAYKVTPTYEVGRFGPGGGIVFYYSATPFTASKSSCNTNCHYLEMAPPNWSDTPDPKLTWSADTTNTISGLGNGVGTGSANTELMKNQSGAGNTTNNAGLLALSYGADDGSVGQWYVPSSTELNLAFDFSSARNNFSGFVYHDWYWSSFEVGSNSTQIDAASYVQYPHAIAPKSWLLNLRPIRAF
ncbi:MAG: hypothetical protein WCG39_05560 [Actinomycetes bacterium]